MKCLSVLKSCTWELFLVDLTCGKLLYFCLTGIMVNFFSHLRRFPFKLKQFLLCTVCCVSAWRLSKHPYSIFRVLQSLAPGQGRRWALWNTAIYSTVRDNWTASRELLGSSRHEIWHEDDSDLQPLHKGPGFKMKSQFKRVEILDQMPVKQIYLKINSKNGEEQVINATLNSNSEWRYTKN